MNFEQAMKDNWWVYMVCLIAILICMTYYYNIEKYQQANTHAWQKFVDECNCQCIKMNNEPMFDPNITKEFNIPIWKEIKDNIDLNDSNG